MSAFAGAAHYAPEERSAIGEVMTPVRFGDSGAEYAAARAGAALYDRSDRGLVVARGGDRKTWLHALVTNAVSTLEEGGGNYAFAIDQRGRVLFDLNVLCLREELWLDVALEFLPQAVAHLERYLIIEDVQLRDATPAWARLAICGPGARAIAETLGAGQFAAMPALASYALPGGAARLVRHDFAGLPGFEMYVPRAEAVAWWDRMAGELGAKPAGFAALDVLRIEAGIPWLGRDIDGQVVAPETGQIERGISYQKGCYLGQEIIERMRSHGSQARRLERVECADGAGLSPPAALYLEEREAGRLTSLVRHPVDGRWVGLAYVRMNVPARADLTAGEPRRVVRLVSGEKR